MSGRDSDRLQLWPDSIRGRSENYANSVEVRVLRRGIMHKIIPIAVVTTVFGVLLLSLVPARSPWTASTGPQLVSVQRLPDSGEMCTWDTAPPPFDVAGRPEE